MDIGGRKRREQVFERRYTEVCSGRKLFLTFMYREVLYVADAGRVVAISTLPPSMAVVTAYAGRLLFQRGNICACY